MNDLIGMKIAKGHQDLGTNKLDLILRESFFYAQMIEYISSFYELKEEINSQVVLDHVFHWQDEWIFIQAKEHSEK